MCPDKRLDALSEPENPGAFGACGVARPKRSIGRTKSLRATCPITRNGCLRIMAHPAYPNRLPAPLVAQRLHEATATDYHRFWPDDVSLLHPDVSDWSRIIGPNQITDVYLLALAVGNKGRFVTFDARTAPGTVPGAGDRRYCVI